jgi:hypothetical protein
MDNFTLTPDGMCEPCDETDKGHVLAAACGMLVSALLHGWHGIRKATVMRRSTRLCHSAELD